MNKTHDPYDVMLKAFKDFLGSFRWEITPILLQEGKIAKLRRDFFDQGIWDSLSTQFRQKMLLHLAKTDPKAIRSADDAEHLQAILECCADPKIEKLLPENLQEKLHALREAVARRSEEGAPRQKPPQQTPRPDHQDPVLPINPPPMEHHGRHAVYARGHQARTAAELELLKEEYRRFIAVSFGEIKHELRLLFLYGQQGKDLCKHLRSAGCEAESQKVFWEIRGVFIYLVRSYNPALHKERIGHTAWVHHETHGSVSMDFFQLPPQDRERFQPTPPRVAS